MDEQLDSLNDTLTIKNTTIIKRLVKYLKPYKLQCFFALLLSVGAAICSSVEIFSNIELVSVLQESNVNYQIAIKFGLIYTLALALGVIFSFTSSYIIQIIANRIIYDLRNDIYSHILYLSTAQIQEMKIGKWVTRVTNDVNSIMNFFSDVLSQIVVNCLYLIFYTISMFILEWHLGLVVLGFMLIIFGVSWAFSYISKKKNRLIKNALSTMNSFLSENLTGMNTIQIFNQEENKKEEFDNVSREYQKRNIDALWVFSLFRPTIYFLYIMSILVSFIVGFYLMRTNNLVKTNQINDISVLFGFYQFIGYVFQPIQTLANQFNTINQALTGAEKIFLVLDIKPNITSPKEEIKHLDNFKGKVEFRHVFFKYNEKQDWILNDVSFIIEPKQVVAFVGQTGAGKSTIINLIVRNYDIQKGEILIDDIPIRSIPLDELRKAIGEMLQDVFLFSGTINYNIALSDEFNSSQVQEAVKFVGAEPFITRLENQYEHLVYENGNNFSSGERQLISFARTIYSKPKMIILDEATSNIDTETEKIIHNSLERIKSIGTMIMIAHRLSTIKSADYIYVVSDGKIAEQGTHTDLLKKKGIYYNLYSIQLINNKEGIN